jgi:cytidine deaminase
MIDVNQLPDSARELHEAATAAMAQSYSPYSGYPVGAAVRTSSGRVFAGCNVENASYPLGSCAEAGVIAAMVLAGERHIVEVVTTTGGERPGTPCGGCRQRLREFAALTVPVYATTAHGTVVALTIGELLPESFGPEFLHVDPNRGHSSPT